MANPLSFDAYTPAGGGRLTAVLGPTNTGKTHYALERMLAHQSGMIGLPLRLLAREIYDRIARERGVRDVALVTGEEKIIPKGARYWVATVEAMPLEREVDFLAIDEIQLCADRERGRVFTSRLLHARGRSETLLLGSDTMRPILQRLFGSIQFIARDRFSKLSYAGPKKVSRLPRRTAIVAFSSDSVYAIAELIRRQRGGAAVVLGALSPRTRNAQAELYQSGEVDYLVATDAIGMGLNMDIDHVAFAARRKFDGRGPRQLTPAEMAQIAGRAGRHIRDGTFGVTSDCPPLDEEIVLAIEDHQFDPVKALQWRSESIDLSSLPALLRSLERPPLRPELVRSRHEDDEFALRRLTDDPDIRDFAKGGAALSTLWDICQVPDFRKVSVDQHARLLGELYLALMRKGGIDDDFLAPRVNRLDRIDGDIDAISARIAYIRTWTFLSHRSHWLSNAAYWQERTRAIEDRLSDALHEKLTQRFVDRRTSTLMKRLKDDAPLLAGVTDDGEVIVEGQFIGRLMGFDFIVDPRATGVEAKHLRAAGERALRPVLAVRASALANATADELSLEDDGAIVWRSSIVAKLVKGPAPLRPDIAVRGLEQISPNMRGRVEDRLKDYLAARIEGLLGPLIVLQGLANAAGDNALKGVTKGVAYRLVENFGATSRAQFGDELKQIDQTERGRLRQAGMRFGEYTLFVPALLKPAPARLLLLLWSLWADRDPAQSPPPKAGLVSLEMNENLPHAYYYAAGYRPSGTRAVRIDMLERLANLIRSARNDANMREGFEANSQMMSIVGCSGEDFEAIMRSLGFRKTMVKRKPPAETSKPEQTGEQTPPVPAEKDAPSEPETDSAVTDTSDAQPTAQPTDAQSAPQPTNEAAPAESIGVTAPQTPESAEPSAPADPTPVSPAAATGPQADRPDSAPQAQDQSAPQIASSDAAPVASPEALAAPEEIEVALWRPAPRKPHGKPQGKHQAKPQGKQTRDARKPLRDDGENKGRDGPKKGKPARKDKGSQDQRGKPRRNDPPMMHEPRHRRTADPDSPFAVLAGLKTELTQAGDKPPARKPSEKTE